MPDFLAMLERLVLQGRLDYPVLQGLQGRRVALDQMGHEVRPDLQGQLAIQAILVQLVHQALQDLKV